MLITISSVMVIAIYEMMHFYFTDGVMEMDDDVVVWGGGDDIDLDFDLHLHDVEANLTFSWTDDDFVI